MGKEITARNEGCSRGLYRGESERENEAGRVETQGELNSRRCTSGLEAVVLFSLICSQCCFQPVTDTFV